MEEQKAAGLNNHMQTTKAQSIKLFHEHWAFPTNVEIIAFVMVKVAGTHPVSQGFDKECLSLQVKSSPLWFLLP